MEPLAEAVETASALRRIRRLQPAGGTGDYIAPPTYPHPEKGKKWGVHSYEIRRIGGEDVKCVLLDSVQSQAARMEESLVRLTKGEYRVQASGGGGGSATVARDSVPAIPKVVVDFTDSAGVSDIGEVSSMELPHRIFDAAIRDSMLDGRLFPETEIGAEVSSATPRNASPILKYSATSLVYGAWKSYWGGTLAAKFQRCITSEIIGVNAQECQSPASKTDMFNISRDVKITMKDGEMILGGGGKKPSEHGHGSIVSTEIPRLGVTVDYAKQTTVITLAGLRRLGFQGADEGAARSALAALAILGAEGEATYTSLRSRCDLVRDGGQSEWEVVEADGSTRPLEIGAADALRWLDESSKALEPGAWKSEPTVLRPSDSLVALIQKSRERMLGEEASSRGGKKARAG